MTGFVKWFDPVKGYGFIEEPEEHKDYFFHFTAIEADKGERKTLKEDDKVSFELENDFDRGKAKAIKVRKL
jgi:CspA family cold shock protein